MGFTFNISIIYGSNAESERRELWRTLHNLHSYLSGAWILIIGDFNIVKETHEKKGGQVLSSSKIQEFNDCLEDCGLLDLRVEGAIWSLSNSSNSQIVGRLDRSLVNQEWINHFPTTFSKYLPASSSDHSPILVRL